MKIEINKIPPQGLTEEEEIDPSSLDLETDIFKFRKGLIKIKANISKITNAVTVEMALEGLMYATCSRCLNDFEINLNKNVKLNPAPVLQCGVNKPELVIDLDPSIKEEIILDYPIKPLCSPNCKGLCPKCGKNLNEGNCNCL